MENSIAPEGIDAAIEIGDVEAVRAWLDTGGDVNAKCPYSRSKWGPYNTRYPLGPLLIVAARWGKTSIMDLLLTRGADVDATDADGSDVVWELLNYYFTYGSLPALRLLLSHGAHVNLRKQTGFLFSQTPLMIATAFAPDVVRTLLRAGADPELRDAHGCTAEEHARARLDRARDVIGAEQCADLLRDVHLAGGWTHYFLRPHKSLLVLRALCHRGRATYGNRTPEVLVRLFGAPDARRRKYTIRGRVHLPDPLFWRVLEFALGPVYDYPWVRQRVRAHAAAVAAERRSLGRCSCPGSSSLSDSDSSSLGSAEYTVYL